MGGKWKQWQILFSWPPKSLQWLHEIKRYFLLGRKAMTNLDSVLKSRDISLLTKVHIIKAVVFPVVMYVWKFDHKKAECHRTDSFELWCWRRLLSVPWRARRLNQSILNIHWKDWCWSWSFSTLATRCKELTHWKRPWCWERPWGQKKGLTVEEMVGLHHWLDGHEFEQSSGDSKGQWSPACWNPWSRKESDAI